MNRSVLRGLLIKHEGLSTQVYRDTVGKLSIGCGRNLDDVGISTDEAMVLLDNDINRIVAALTSHVACFGSLDATRQHVLVDLAYNVGIAGLLHFTKMLAAVEARDFVAAATEMLASRWAQQVPTRAEELAGMMQRGV